ncbi:hypothetical protein [Tenacibaculum sp. nBUS_03]|uniref:hypothetical protein n=1 Tax=Tenacibaculum sp. nBUS_03 TaxID=3395320 RepID=UPI003EB7CB8D
MKKLSLEALEARAELVVSNELLNTISGGTENACHDDKKSIPDPPKPKGPNGNGGPLIIIHS